MPRLRCATFSAPARQLTPGCATDSSRSLWRRSGSTWSVAVLAFLFEHHQKQTQIESVGSALFWTTTQLLTVSSSMQNPISLPGRVLDVVMEIYAITVIATLAGAFGAFLVKRGEELDAAVKAGHGSR